MDTCSSCRAANNENIGTPAANRLRFTADACLPAAASCAELDRSILDYTSLATDIAAARFRFKIRFDYYAA